MSNDAVEPISDHTDTWVGHWEAKKTGKWIDYVLFLVSLSSLAISYGFLLAWFQVLFRCQSTRT